MQNLSRRLSAEVIGTALLLAIVVGSGIMGERLAGGNVAVALLGNTLATGSGLLVLILMFGPISGAHFNPIVSIAEAWDGNLSWYNVPHYIVAQLVGAFAGVAIAHMMFSLPIYSISLHDRGGLNQEFSEFIASFGLMATIISCSRQRPTATPLAVCTYIVSAYWFTASTSFANPAVTLARSLTNSFSGIRPQDTIGFIGAQFLGMVIAVVLFRWLIPKKN